MSSAKFAAITASLLARKGDAAPSVVAPAPDNAEKLRRIVVSITQDELERLGIATIKRGTNRHDIVRAALNDYFRKLAAELPQPCACMEGSPTLPARHAEI